MAIPNFSQLLQDVLQDDVRAWEQWSNYRLSNAFCENCLKETITILEEKLIQNPNDSHALVLRAYMHENGQVGSVNYTAAITLYERAIELGNNTAMNNRACMHENGQGGPVNYTAAIALYERAIELGNDLAMYRRASMHHNGQGGPVNYAAAIILYERVIELGNDLAMYRRASMHHDGEGGPVNYAAAITLYERAIELGNSWAMNNRAFMHQHNQGCPMNYAAAITLYERAIKLGSSLAMTNRAYMYQYSQGGPMDYAAAIILYERAIELGNYTAMTYRALMHYNGQGGPVNYAVALILFKQSYFIGQDVNILSLLKQIFEQTKSLEALHTLMLCYLKSNQIEAAKELFAQHPNELNSLLYPYIHQLINKLPEEEQFTQLLIDFVTKMNDDSRLQYIQFKIALYNEEEQQAFDLYTTYLKEVSELTASDFYRLGTFCLSGVEGLSPKHKIKKWEQACEFFLKGFRQGDKDRKTMLIHILSAKEALAAGLPAPEYCLQKNDDESENRAQELINRFCYKMQQNLLREANNQQKTALLTFIEIKKHLLQKKKVSSKSMKLAEKIVLELNQDPLEIILKKPHILNRIKKDGALYKILNGFFAPNDDNPLKLIINERDCKAIIKQTNNGESIYQVLTSGKCISSKGLKILAQQQRQTLDYIKVLSGTVQQEAIKKALDSNSLLGQYFHIKCGLFSSHSTPHTLKVLKRMQGMKP
ncbi:hypothetical protein [Legionella sp.]|uniref:SEL1-like repeat protein n=1 Tax=Legionella sp. TaxID=459 RepID=UPI003CBE1F6D